MKKKNFLQSQLLWLYFYLWQIELSIDRAIHGGWEDMVDFLSSRADIEQVLSKFIEIHYFDNTPAEVARRRLLKNYYRRMFDKKRGRIYFNKQNPLTSATTTMRPATACHA